MSESVPWHLPFSSELAGNRARDGFLPYCPYRVEREQKSRRESDKPDHGEDGTYSIPELFDSRPEECDEVASLLAARPRASTEVRVDESRLFRVAILAALSWLVEDEDDDRRALLVVPIEDMRAGREEHRALKTDEMRALRKRMHIRRTTRAETALMSMRYRDPNSLVVVVEDPRLDLVRVCAMLVDAASLAIVRRADAQASRPS